MLQVFVQEDMKIFGQGELLPIKDRKDLNYQQLEGPSKYHHQGKVEAELILMTGEEAEKNPAGLGRDDPNG